MIIVALLLGALAAAPHRDTLETLAPPPDSSSVVVLGALPAVRLLRDTAPMRPRPRAVTVSDGYATRLRVHRIASYTMIPLFAAQSIAGNQLYQSGGSDPRWAKTLHVVGAGGLGTLFGINTVTGVWNMWETRHQEEGRTRRLIHSGFLLASDAGFAYAGIKLGPDATRSGEKRREHRRVALISMSSALAGYASMLIGSR